MSKFCEIKPYIKTITSDPKEQEVLNNLHNQIFNEIKASKNFNYTNGYLMEKDITKGYVDKVNAGRKTVAYVQEKYGLGTAWIGKSRSGDRNHVYVSVRPIAKNYINKGDDKGDNQLTLFQLTNKEPIKPGVSELFSFNPELANQVYEALGFKQFKFESLSKYSDLNDLSLNKKDEALAFLQSLDGKKLFSPSEMLNRISNAETSKINKGLSNYLNSILEQYKGIYSEESTNPYRIEFKENLKLGDDRDDTIGDLRGYNQDGYKVINLTNVEANDLIKTILHEFVHDIEPYVLYKESKLIKHTRIKGFEGNQFLTQLTEEQLKIGNQLENLRKFVIKHLADKFKNAKPNSLKNEIERLENGGLITIYGETKKPTSVYINNLKNELNAVNKLIETNKVEEFIENNKNIFLNSEYNHYGVTNLNEFITEALTNEKFRNLLNEIPYKNTTVLSYLFELFQKILGIKKDTVLSEALNLVHELATTKRNQLRDFQITPQQEQQAKILYSQYLDSLNKPNTNPILLGNQQEQVKKFAELQERLNNKEFLEGAKNAYESTPALQQYGTQAEYNDYIARVSLGIIKNPTSGEYNYTSKVKDILYHTTTDIFDVYDETKIKGTDHDLGKFLYLSRSKEDWKSYVKTSRLMSQLRAENINEINDNDIINLSFIVNLKNPYETYDYYLDRLNSDNDFNFTKNIQNKYDGIIETNNDQIAIFKPKNYHRLGGKQDIEGFKEFVSGKSSQQILPQLKSTKTDSKEIIEQIDKNLNDYIKNNNINIEFKNQVLDSNGNDVVAFYDDVKKVIEINEGKRDSKTLPEELAHHLHLALGKDHILVKRAFNLLNRVDYRSILGEEYVKMYNNDSTLLKFELLGKLTADAVIRNKAIVALQNENGNKLWETIKNIIKAAIRLFKPDYNVQNELDELTNRFSNMLLEGKSIKGDAYGAKLYSLSQKKIDLDAKIKPQYVYYTKQIKSLERQLSNLDKDTKEYNDALNKINTMKSAIKELLDNNNTAPLVALVDETLNEVQNYIDKLQKLSDANKSPLVKNLAKTYEVLSGFSKFPGSETRVEKMLSDLSGHVISYLSNESSRLTGTEITEEQLTKTTKDINPLEKGFGTLVDVENHLASSLGLLIKEAQNFEERDNKKAFSEVEKYTNKLKEWADSNGISESNMYDILQQEYRGTTVLTKPYTSEFYEEINKSFKMPQEEGYAYRKSIAIYDSVNKEFIPKDKAKYTNKNYTEIMSTPELREYYTFFKNTIKDISDNVLPLTLNGDFIPNVFEETLFDVLKSQDSLDSKAKKSIIKILQFNPFEKEADAKYIYDEDLITDELPLKYIKALSSETKSKNLSAALLKFMYFANSYKHMSEVLPKAKLYLEVSKNNKYIKYGDNTLSINGVNSNLHDMMQIFVDIQVLGKKKNNEKINLLGLNVNYGQGIDSLLKYTSILRIGLNPFNAVTNIAVGNLGNVIEAAGGRYFKLNDYLKSMSLYSTGFMDSGSKVNKLIDLFNPLMEMDDYENLSKLIGTKQYREKINNLMYSWQRAGEKQMQTCTLISMLLNKQVSIMKNGVEIGKISMYEAFDENGKWDTNKMGYELSEQEIMKITNKTHRINQMIHGRYSAKDAATLSQYSLFRAAFQFKKWIPAAIESRFAAKKYDARLEDYTQGRYWVYAKAFKLMLAKLKNDAKAIEDNKFDELDAYSMRKNAIEMLLILAVLGLKWGFEDDDDKKKAWYKMYMRQINQISGDLLFFYNPKEMTDLAFGGVPAAKTLKDIYKTAGYLPYIFGDVYGDNKNEYSRGPLKGENRFWANIINLTPVLNPIVNTGRSFKKDVGYIEPQ